MTAPDVAVVRTGGSKGPGLALAGEELAEPLPPAQLFPPPATDGEVVVRRDLKENHVRNSCLKPILDTIFHAIMGHSVLP